MISIAEASHYEPGLGGLKKTLRKIEKGAKPYYGPAIMATGVVLAPFTGGVSLVAATAVAGGLEAGMSVRAQKKAARSARKQAAIEDSMFAADMMPVAFPTAGPTPMQIAIKRIAEKKRKQRKQTELVATIGAGVAGVAILALALRKK